MMQAIATTKMPMKFSAAVRLQQERMYRQAFHYFDRDRDGFIGEKDLLQVRRFLYVGQIIAQLCSPVLSKRTP